MRVALRGNAGRQIACHRAFLSSMVLTVNQFNVFGCRKSNIGHLSSVFQRNLVPTTFLMLYFQGRLRQTLRKLGQALGHALFYLEFGNVIMSSTLSIHHAVINDATHTTNPIPTTTPARSSKSTPIICEYLNPLRTKDGTGGGRLGSAN
jgi:hypothetical protein